MGSVYIVVLLTNEHNLWGKLWEWQDISRKVAGYGNPRGARPAPALPIYIIKPATTAKQQGGVKTPPYK